MTPRQKHDFCADPDNHDVHGQARRRNSKLSDPTPTPDDDRTTPAFVAAGESGAGISNQTDELLADGFGRS